MESIASDPKADREEKRRMMEMLRRFEERAAAGDNVFAEVEEEEEEEEDELVAALGGVSLGKSIPLIPRSLTGVDEIDSNQLFHLLPQAYRDKFLSVLRNPESEDAKELLQAAIQEDAGNGGMAENPPPVPDVLPWWEAPDIPDEEVGPYADPPGMLDDGVVAGIKPPEGVGLKLAFNAVALW
jgi:hypothetical protein